MTIGHSPDEGSILGLIRMSSGFKNLEVVERCSGAVDLKSQVRSLLVKNRVLRVGKVLVVNVSHKLVTEEFDGRRVPRSGFEFKGTFSVTA